mmetsp:Transcript_49648/g.118214  ORF Transcript_49648/g.118214 Transcript_49648/m.118214 type:complete len:228 (-) Transcript_49648:3461-4144(-)
MQSSGSRAELTERCSHLDTTQKVGAKAYRRSTLTILRALGGLLTNRHGHGVATSCFDVSMRAGFKASKACFHRPNSAYDLCQSAPWNWQSHARCQHQHLLPKPTPSRHEQLLHPRSIRPSCHCMYLFRHLYPHLPSSHLQSPPSAKPLASSQQALQAASFNNRMALRMKIWSWDRQRLRRCPRSHSSMLAQDRRQMSKLRSSLRELFPKKKQRRSPSSWRAVSTKIG